MFGRGFNDLPVTAESIGDEETVTGFEALNGSIVADQADMPENDKTVFVAIGEGTPFPRSACPHPRFKICAVIFKAWFRCMLGKSGPGRQAPHRHLFSWFG